MYQDFMKEKTPDEYAAPTEDSATSFFSFDQMREFIVVRESALKQLTNQYLDVRCSGPADAAKLREQRSIADAYQHFADELACMMRLCAQDVGPQGVADDADDPGAF